ncbi:leucine efflux protein LeuE [Nocardioides jishulii]|uniref:Leucine efflux protein LeuE n=1 Tax=Nocardioides jishulii TaxID=2575440 RepID=A0A4U2YMA9_9ACTN|nr:leucine efflux protein LeuE [Nocardioides jishulii]QCX27582.1 leucine efflux protein LeuE [Nocardioides jishulii]TKI62389.1 leucine efflux protein LeuE [Nocardioides jishulii]
MLGVIDLPTYLVGLVVIILLPGPNSLYVLSVAARSGVRPAYAAAAAVWTGDALLMTCAAAGVASLLQSNDLVFSIVKYAGAGYLSWMGIGLVRGGILAWRGHRGRSADALVEEVEQASGGVALRSATAYRRALVISLLNPKAILFFVSFFVQFVDPTYPRPWVSFLFLGSFATLTSVLYLSALIFGGVRLAEVFRRRQAITAGVTSAAGMVFLGFAVKLSLATAG